MKTCKQCNTGFEVEDWDRKFYEKMDVPEPTLCPQCRQQRRLAHINQIHLYKRKCDATNEEIVSMYPPDAPIPVYSQPYWWGDDWDATIYGQDFDFSRPFFEQWDELSRKVPRQGMETSYTFNENATYTNNAGFLKNCYMLFDSDYSWDCYYSTGVNKGKNCMDCYRIKACELCYDCVDSVKCYGLKYSQDCDNCSESAFLKNCIGCKHCFMCSNLKNKEYYIYNKQYDKKTYERLINSLSKRSELPKYFKEWKEFKLKFPQKYMHGTQNENVIGDYMVHSKNAEYCFDSLELWDCKYFYRSFGSAKDSMDCDECGVNVENFYDTFMTGHNVQNARFSIQCFNESFDLDYCYDCFFTQHCFGCVGLMRKKYCILNKQYSKEEYEAFVPKIIEYMKSTGEWGEFFPAKYSLCAYNESIAQEYYPLTKEEVLKRGWEWRNPDKKEYQPASAQVPDDSMTVDKAICNEVFACEDCGRNYKIIEQELKFYQDQKIPIPKKCFYCRYANRFNMRNKRTLYDRKCDKCGVDIKTTYSPDQPEKIYCEACYLDSLV